ncbi:hypothetical protein DPMN_057418 [Dreissena polymorpha]|uniref:C-type lectin domain-containing protein n=1 Tax=Dreissena polymorpha TaxID=45954 RepID=A0A9D4C020_DREPO|nr:hypothetical protein DPMN_057418 [Dreissena polymorpha]
MVQEVTARSRILCIGKCQDVPHCLLVTYAADTGLCRLYRDGNTLDCSSQNDMFIDAYRKKKVPQLKAFNIKKSWIFAQEYCIGQGGRLAVATGNTTLSDLSQMVPGEIFWVGGRKLSVGWTWLSGEFMSSDPSTNGHVTGPCLLYVFNGLHDHECDGDDYDGNFVCELF